MTYRHANAMFFFLQATYKELDPGVAGQLQSIALAHDGERLQRAFMLSDEVQEFPEKTAHAALANSLAAERKAAEVKRRDGAQHQY